MFLLWGFRYTIINKFRIKQSNAFILQNLTPDHKWNEWFERNPQNTSVIYFTKLPHNSQKACVLLLMFSSSGCIGYRDLMEKFAASRNVLSVKMFTCRRVNTLYSLPWFDQPIYPVGISQSWIFFGAFYSIENSPGLH